MLIKTFEEYTLSDKEKRELFNKNIAQVQRDKPEKIMLQA